MAQTLDRLGIVDADQRIKRFVGVNDLSIPIEHEHRDVHGIQDGRHVFGVANAMGLRAHRVAIKTLGRREGSARGQHHAAAILSLGVQRMKLARWNAVQASPLMPDDSVMKLPQEELAIRYRLQMEHRGLRKSHGCWTGTA
ncbi:hypothetical protein [Rhodospira trueperi]|uniref:hypothetical protein n=1 Tax=Rhodospira trueperi TaxID=69960 RepID=UPI001FE229E2|nr:hypothetical protein [Rhodospira trueperi]